MQFQSLDTYKIVQNLRQAGMNEDIAAVLSNTFRETRETDLSQLLTKDEFALHNSEMNAEFSAVRAEMKSEFSAVRAEMKVMRSELKAEIAEVKAELKADIAELRTELKADIASVRSEIAEVKAELKADIAQLEKKMDVGFEKVYKTLSDNNATNLKWQLAQNLAMLAFIAALIRYMIK